MVLRLLPVVLFVFAALGSLWLQRADATRMPDEVELAEAAQAIQQQLDPTISRIRILPLWFDAARVGLDDYRFHTASTLDPCEHPAATTLAFGFPRREGGHRREAMRWLQDPETVYEGRRWTVLAGHTPRSTQVWDGHAALDQATIERVHSNGRVTPCRLRHRGGFHCGSFHEWVYVAAGWRNMNQSYEACITANPPGAPERWRISWDDVPLSGNLRLRAGNVVFAARSERGTPVRVRMTLDDELLLEEEIALRDPTYHNWSIPLTGRQETGRLSVEIVAESGSDRFFCFRPLVCRSDAGEAP